MHLEILIICITLFFFFFLLVCHILVVRFLEYRNAVYSQQLVLVLCALVVNVPLLVSSYLIVYNAAPSLLLPSLLYIFLVYNSVAYAYFHIFNMSETARRIKLLILIKQHKHDAINEREYSADAMVDNRIERLIRMGQITVAGEKYVTRKPWLLLVNHIIDFWKKIINMEHHPQTNQKGM